MATKKLTLSKPYDIDGKQITEIEFNEPTGSIYFELGEPRILGRSRDDMLYFIDNDEIIKAYVTRCVVGADGPFLVKMLGLKDARAARSLILGFFMDDEPVT